MQLEIDNIDKIDIEILYMLYTRDKTSPLYSMHTQAIVDTLKNKTSYYTVLRRLNKLVEKELLAYGYKERNAKTYYLKESGSLFISETVIEENIDLNKNTEEYEDKQDETSV